MHSHPSTIQTQGDLYFLDQMIHQTLTLVSIFQPLQAVAREWFGNGVPPPVEGRWEASLTCRTNAHLTTIFVIMRSCHSYTLIHMFFRLEFVQDTGMSITHRLGENYNS